jgi:D-hexose-6-phosphate mutarotase
MIDALNEQFAIRDALHFERGRGDLTCMRIATETCRATVYLQGAHLTDWQPRRHHPVLFMSARSAFAPGKAIRGGIPVVFPWFGPNAHHPHAPMHGFARTAEWRVLRTTTMDDGALSAVFGLDVHANEQPLWPCDCELRMTFVFGTSLNVSMQVHNRAADAITFEQALHSYFNIADIARVRVGGLEHTTYIDKCNDFKQARSGEAAVMIQGETDRVYLDTAAACTIDDPGLHRQITIEKLGSQSTVLWNPWMDKAANMPDFGDDEWPSMVCIETANVKKNGVTLAPGATHTMSCRITVAQTT